MKRKNKKFQKRGSKSLNKLVFFKKTDGKFSKNASYQLKMPMIDYQKCKFIKKICVDNGKIVSSKITSVSF